MEKCPKSKFQCLQASKINSFRNIFLVFSPGLCLSIAEDQFTVSEDLISVPGQRNALISFEFSEGAEVYEAAPVAFAASLRTQRQWQTHKPRHQCRKQAIATRHGGRFWNCLALSTSRPGGVLVKRTGIAWWRAAFSSGREEMITSA